MAVEVEEAKFTNTESKIMQVLDDGQPHPVKELCLVIDEMTTNKALGYHIVQINKKLKPQGRAIVCVFRYRKYHYQQFRLLASPNSGRN